MLLRLVLRCLPLAPAVLAMAAHAAQQVTIELRAEVLLSAPHMVLADLASVDAGDPQLTRAIAALSIGNAPMAGYVDRRSRAELEVALRGQQFPLGQRIAWLGARSVTIRRASRMLEPALPLAAATRYLSAVLGQKYAALELSLAAPLPELALPPGQVECKARAIDQQQIRARMPVWVDVFVDGTFYRSVVVPLMVVARQEVYVARRALAEGASLAPQDVMPVTQDVAGLQDEPLKLASLAGTPRLRAALAQGQVLTARQVAPPGMVLRGDRVTLVLENNGILLETAALAQADAQVGQALLVRMRQGSDAVAARVVAPGVVRIDER